MKMKGATTVENYWSIISLVGLVSVVFIANKKNINVGLVGIAMAMLIGTMAGMKAKAIIGGFNSTLFVRAMGMQCLIAVAKLNGTLECVSKRIVKLGSGRAIKVFPILLFFALLLCEYLGTGVFSMAMPILCALAFEMGMPVLKVVGIGLITMSGAGTSPYAPPGIILRGLAEDAGLTVNLWNTAFSGFIVSTTIFIIFYFVWGWHKQSPIQLKTELKAEPLNWKQWATIAGYAVFVFCNLGLDIDTAVTPIIVALVLCLIGAGDGTQLIKRLPFNSLIMVGGMTIMVGVVNSLGGIDIIINGLSLVATKTLAPGLMAGLASCMSVISSAQGVVLPTLVPTVAGLCEAMPGLAPQTLITAIGLGAYATGISPLSTTGGNVLANYGTVYGPTPEEEKKLFNQLLIMAGLQLLAYTVAGFVGVYSIILFN